MSRAHDIRPDIQVVRQSAAQRGARTGSAGAGPGPGCARRRAAGGSRELGTGPSLLDELLTAAEVAAILRLRVSTVEDYARRGVLPSVKVGRHRRFVRSQLERAIAARFESAS